MTEEIEILDRQVTVEHQTDVDSDWVFSLVTRDDDKASSKANSLWQNPKVRRVRTVETVKRVLREKNR